MLLLVLKTLIEKSRLASVQSNSTSSPVGIIDPIYNKGPLFWYRLDASVRTELEQQYMLSQEGNAPPFGGDVLFGIAQTITGQKPTYLDRMLRYLTDAAKSGYSPARAVYAQVMEAHGQALGFGEDVLDDWMLQAVSEGYLFAKPDQLTKDMEIAKGRFRESGGFCSDPFLIKSDVTSAIKGGKVMKWYLTNGAVVDRQGNTLLHAAAAFGAVAAVQELLDTTQIEVDTGNENAETPLYKAFQAGHTDVIGLLLDHGASASCRTRQNIGPLHWLFMIPEDSIHQITKRMIEGGADVNAIMEPVVKENSGGFPEKIQILH